MNLYVDDDSAKGKLITFLRQAENRVFIPAECGTTGTSDARHFEYATRNGLVLLTRNYDDFAELHDVVQRSIVGAIGKLESVNMPLDNQIHVLNHWR